MQPLVKDVTDLHGRIGRDKLGAEINAHLVPILQHNAAVLELAALLEDVRTFIERYVIFSIAGQSDVIALWVVHCWAIEAFEYTPYLHVVSPEKQCAKSRVLDCLEVLLAPRA